MAKSASKVKPAAQPASAPKRKAASGSSSSTRFEGFPPGAMQFWFELATEMSKPWFDANKGRYEAEWVTPMKALLDEVAAGLAAAYRPLPLAAPKVMRIHRDVRFSKNKAPYKTNIGGVITLGDSLAAGGCAAMYVHVGLDEQFVGVGSYAFDAERLARFRKAVSEKPGAELQSIVDALRKAGYVVGGHDDYKKVPAGFDPGHPRAELLKMKGLTAMFPAVSQSHFFERGLARRSPSTAPLPRRRKWPARHARPTRVAPCRLTRVALEERHGDTALSERGGGGLREELLSRRFTSFAGSSTTPSLRSA
ncbi:MAG: DUF2461 domain-containing protein [Polyangiaceae bacterium]